MLRSDDGRDVAGVGDQVGDGAHAVAQAAVGPQPDDAARRRDGAQFVVGEVAGEVLHRPCSAVRGHHRRGRPGDDRKARLPVGVGHVVGSLQANLRPWRRGRPVAASAAGSGSA